MENLTFGEQVKIVLSRKGMTIKELAESIETHTGKKMSRQNLTQRLGRDNFQEQDMRMIASILDCPFTLNILNGVERKSDSKPTRSQDTLSQDTLVLFDKDTPSQTEEERDITIGELYNIHKELTKIEEGAQTGEIPVHLIQEELAEDEILQEEFEEDLVESENTFIPALRRTDLEEDRTLGDVNPYTGHEYQSNSVRMHPNRIGYVQVYDRANHKWTDMTEWAFLGYQERKKALLGKDYEAPIYLD
ncbi:MAG: hypothetical protein HFH53_01135 [Hespellia sp.]|jgi:hypothetical protein|nr:hypothetical protein [Hespellia sp.]